MTSPTPTPSRRSRRRVRVCEDSNTEVTFVNDLSAAEHTSIWYSQDEFRRMKLERRTSVAQHHSNRSNMKKEKCNDQDDCLRGLEKLMPSAKAAARQKRVALLSIVQMSRQLKARQNIDGMENERKEQDEVLRQFCLTKTSYSQHKAYYMAARDAAIIGGTIQECACKMSLQKSIGERNSTTRSNSSSKNSRVRFSSVNPRFVQRCVPMAAQTA